jgi:F0F1-type ATP synthase assembly protein I
MGNAKIYRWIKIGGILSFIPLVLVSGPLVGFLAGDYIEKRVGFAPYISFTLITIGLIASVMETVRIIKISLKEEGRLK